METFIQKAIANYDNACDDTRDDVWDEDEAKPVSRLRCVKDTSVVCPVCGKRFTPAPQHSYKQYRTNVRVCTYSCSVRSEREFFDGSKPSRMTLRQRIEKEEAAERAKQEAKREKQEAKLAARAAEKEQKRKSKRTQRALTMATVQA